LWARVDRTVISLNHPALTNIGEDEDLEDEHFGDEGSL